MTEKVNVPTWESMFWALVESMEQDGKEVKIDEHVSVKHTRWSRGEMFYVDDYNVEVFSDFGISILCCEDDEEYAGEVASIILERFERWYERQVHPVKSIFDATCWEQAEPFYWEVKVGLESDVFKNCVCGIEGYEYGFDTLIKNEWNYGLPIERTKELWQIAYWWVAEGCMAA